MFVVRLILIDLITSHIKYMFEFQVPDQCSIRRHLALFEFILFLLF
ncbi:hypothetical protein OIU79_006104 [Salix purpurea]|uniref:Uncharacterized protein n=1 Tax=Salix purpurea TaxID=77065 RepID=A0A9Q0Z1N2_SALPP|nr:hypothetical protein OIU79_006104 [Salix purpurea]